MQRIVTLYYTKWEKVHCTIFVVLTSSVLVLASKQLDIHFQCNRTLPWAFSRYECPPPTFSSFRSLTMTIMIIVEHNVIKSFLSSTWTLKYAFDWFTVYPSEISPRWICINACMSDFFHRSWALARSGSLDLYSIISFIPSHPYVLIHTVCVMRAFVTA